MTSAYEILAQLKRTALGPMTEARGAEPAFYWNEEVASAEENAHENDDAPLSNGLFALGDHVLLRLVRVIRRCTAHDGAIGRVRGALRFANPDLKVAQLLALIGRVEVVVQGDVAHA